MIVLQSQRAGRGIGRQAGARRPRVLLLAGTTAVFLGSFAAGIVPAGQAWAARADQPRRVLAGRLVASARLQSRLASASRLWEPRGLRRGDWLRPAAQASPAPDSSRKWRVQPTPNPVLLRNGALLSDSCTGPNACTAVGSAFNGSGVMVTLVQRRSGRSRVIEVTPDPAGAVWSRLFGVSCTSAHACVAVGYYYDAAFRLRPLAERWNGRNWAIQATRRPAGAQATGLLAVSCTSPDACIAAGEYITSSGEPRAMAERWNGRYWAVEVTPSPAGALASGLFGVSCTAARACTAAGAYASSRGKTLTLAEAWNGTRWRVKATPNPRGVPSSELFAVSCSSPRACTAVGSYISDSDGDTRSMAQRWNGTRWTIQVTHDPAGAVSSEFLAVSCGSSRACTAIGDYMDRNADTVTLAQAWNGTRWRSHATPATPKPASIFSNVLTGVSCASPRACTAVGGYLAFNTIAFRSVVLRWNGSRWASQATPDGVGANVSDLAAVSCAAPDACTAVGTFDKTGTRTMSLAETWNGVRWRIHPVPSPAGATGSRLLAVSCRSPRSCAATGSYDTRSGKTLALAGTWNGARWELRPAPSPAGSTDAALESVSCTSPRACTAAGFYFTRSGKGLALAERWNGMTWRIQATAAPASALEVFLGGVACTRVNSCVAIGVYTDAKGRTDPLVETWNGARWRIQTVPSPAGAADVELDSVSCTSPRACTATGTWSTSATDLTYTLAYRWDGKTWSVQATPNPPGFANSSAVSLIGVSCSSASACTATGDYAPDDQPTAFAEVWNGTRWSLQATPAPAGAIASELAAVSCNSRRCTAVGDYDTLSGAELTLAIRSR